MNFILILTFIFKICLVFGIQWHNIPPQDKTESYPDLESDRSDRSDSWNAVTVQCDSRLHVKEVSDRSDRSDRSDGSYFLVRYQYRNIKTVFDRVQSFIIYL
ncbi:MAG: hypothetical protein WAL66_10905 [Nitrososphaeraceae archaeon]